MNSSNYTLFIKAKLNMQIAIYGSQTTKKIYVGSGRTHLPSHCDLIIIGLQSLSRRRSSQGTFHASGGPKILKGDIIGADHFGILQVEVKSIRFEVSNENIRHACTR